MIRHLTCSTDDFYVQHCMAMLCSLFENNKESEFLVHVLMDKLSKESCQLISSLCDKHQNKALFYQIDENKMKGIALSDLQFNGRHAYSMATYYRMLLPSVLSDDIDKILYLDCDVIVLEKVDELYDLNMDDYGLAAVYDCTPYDSYHRYKMGLSLEHSGFCAGVMMINLDYWRKNNAQQKLLDYARRTWKAIYMQDQDALNYVFLNHWFMLPYKWGKTPLSIAPLDSRQRWFDIKEYVFEPCILHYSAFLKPWMDVWFPMRKYYWKYVNLSGFSNPQVTKASISVKKRIYLALLRYSINKYIRPFVPDIIELLFKDILYLFYPLLYIMKQNKLREFILKRWCQKYGMK